MSHGDGGLLLQAAPPPPTAGPRPPLQLGLDSARATQNILRLLEASHGGYNATDTLATVWHSKGLVWRYNENDDWTAGAVLDDERAASPISSSAAISKPPSLLSLVMSDDRTALAKIQGADGLQRYLSVLRLDDDPSVHPAKPAAHDGWQILREVVSSSCMNPRKTSSDGKKKNESSLEAMSKIADTLEQYLAIEHGGGPDTRRQAEKIFAKQACLLAVGTAPLNQAPSDWSSPTGTLLQIPLDIYLQGVESQSPHQDESRLYDAIVQIDVLLPCQTAAFAVVHVGNGSKTMVFVDHLLLGKENKDDGIWKILSKTFTPRPWPQQGERVY